MQITNYAQLMHYIHSNTAYSNAVAAGQHDLAEAMVRFVIADTQMFAILVKQMGTNTAEALAESLLDDLQQGLQILDDYSIVV